MNNNCSFHRQEGISQWGIFLQSVPANEAEKYNTLADNGVGVYQHNTVQYAGVVYFKNQEDAIKAVKILGKRVKSLFD